MAHPILFRCSWFLSGSQFSQTKSKTEQSTGMFLQLSSVIFEITVCLIFVRTGVEAEKEQEKKERRRKEKKEKAAREQDDVDGGEWTMVKQGAPLVKASFRPANNGWGGYKR